MHFADKRAIPVETRAPFAEPVKRRKRSTDHFFKDLGGVADHNRAAGFKKMFLDGFLAALGSVQVDSEQLFAHDGAVDGFEAPHKLFDKAVDLEPGLSFACGMADYETQGHKGACDRSAIPPHAHARTEGPAQFEGGFPLQAVVLAETGKDGLGSRVALFEQGDRFFSGVHGTSRER